MLGKINRRILFLDESGFNLHTSINYGYSPKNQDAFLFQPASKGKNLSLCAIINCTGILNSKIIDGAYNKENFLNFLVESSQKNIFENRPVVILDNVRFHHCENIKSYLISIGVEIVFLPPYSPDFNPIENVFGEIKSKLNKIRPRANDKKGLIKNIKKSMCQLGDTKNYYQHFFKTINEINNRHMV